MKIKQYNMILLIAVLLMAQGLFAGNNMVIKKNDGTVERKAVSDIDKVFFQDTGTVTDVDGNTYVTVQIGDLWWMAENLKTTKYNDDTAIPIEEGDVAWEALETGAYCYYDNDSVSYKETYGALYNWYAVNNPAGLAPTDWRIPTDAEWTELTDYLGGLSVAGGKLKSTGLSLWNSPNTGATDEVGFAALPGGYRDYSSGSFYHMGTSANVWSASEYSTTGAWRRALHYKYATVYRYNNNKKDGFSVRCVKDAAP